MIRLELILIAVFLIYPSSVWAQPPAAPSVAEKTYRIDQTFRLGGEGGWDHLAVDSLGKLLYVCRGTHVMVIDAISGQSVADIAGQKRNHDVAIVPRAGRGFITNSEDASVTVFDLKNHRVFGKIEGVDHADGAIYDPHSEKVLVSCGEAHRLAVISPDADSRSDKPETMVVLNGMSRYLAADRTKIFVNLFDRDRVAVIDSKTMKVVHEWPTAPGGAPVGMAIDSTNHRLFIGCRKPQKLIVMDSENGKVLADLPLGSGADSLQFDGDLFAASRDGTLTVARETAPGKFAVVQTLATKQGAKTMCLDPVTHSLYLPTTELAAGDKGEPLKSGSFMILVVRAEGK